MLAALLDASDDRLGMCWWRLGTIARLVFGTDRYGEDRRAGQRTAGRWMAELRELGWVERIHRYEMVRGQIRWTSNLWRIVIPEELRVEVEALEDAARARAQAGRAPQGRPTPPRTTRAAPLPPPPSQSQRPAEGTEPRTPPPSPTSAGPPVDVEAELRRARAVLVGATKASP